MEILMFLTAFMNNPGTIVHIINEESSITNDQGGIMRKHPVLLCLSVCILCAGMSANNVFALPQYPGEPPFESGQSTSLTLFCSTGIFDSSQPVSVPFGQHGKAVVLPVTQDAAPLAVPEPSSLIFLAIGLGLLGVRTWLRRRTR
jgi:hypothetical protein